ncbi:MAG: uncharacterized protein KVP18_004549 [Porospora cf. gigantea A]|uniref:uncharacterized protein n=1 Tax=Porospora cf. gigantea A TaxID=2853593 RepID=UPI003559E4B2|nr:MAG: hypothetical protein KVP18_004549 [Porospora cf. gigantea A]
MHRSLLIGKTAFTRKRHIWTLFFLSKPPISMRSLSDVEAQETEAVIRHVANNSGRPDVPFAFNVAQVPAAAWNAWVCRRQADDARSCIEALERLADATQKRLVSCKKRLEATGGSLSDATASSMEAQRLYSQRGSHPRVLMAMPAEKLHERDLGLELECRVFGSRVTLETCRRSAAESKRMNFFADVKRKPDEEEVTSELIELALEMKKKAAEQSQHLSIDKELMDHILDSQTANLDHTGQANKQASQLLGLPGGSLLSVVYAVLNTSLGVVGETAKLVLASYLFVTLLFPKGLYYFVWLGGLASVLLLLSWKR